MTTTPLTTPPPSSSPPPPSIPASASSRPAPLPAGWAGKTFACHTLAAHATSTWLLFLDADTHLSPDAPARLAAEAAARRITFLSGWPRFVMLSFPERLLMPMLNFLVFATFPGPLSLVSGLPSLGIAHGACILAHRETYLKLGGHSLVRAEIFEDTRLAHAWRRAGERALCLDAQHLVSVRMYRDFTGIWQGFQKNLYPAFRHNISFFAFLLVHLVCFLLPFIAGFPLAAALVILTRVALAVRFRHPFWSVLLHPFAEAVLIALGLVSFYRCASGRGVSWKGRLYRA